MVAFYSFIRLLLHLSSYCLIRSTKCLLGVRHWENGQSWILQNLSSPLKCTGLWEDGHDCILSSSVMGVRAEEQGCGLYHGLVVRLPAHSRVKGKLWRDSCAESFGMNHCGAKTSKGGNSSERVLCLRTRLPKTHGVQTKMHSMSCLQTWGKRQGSVERWETGQD